MNLKEIVLKGTITWSEMGQQTNEAKEVYCVVFLAETLYSHGASLNPGVDMGTGKFSVGTPRKNWYGGSTPFGAGKD